MKISRTAAVLAATALVLSLTACGPNSQDEQAMSDWAATQSSWADPGSVAAEGETSGVSTSYITVKLKPKSRITADMLEQAAASLAGVKTDAEAVAIIVDGDWSIALTRHEVRNRQVIGFVRGLESQPVAKLTIPIHEDKAELVASTSSLAHIIAAVDGVALPGTHVSGDADHNLVLRSKKSAELAAVVGVALQHGLGFAESITLTGIAETDLRQIAAEVAAVSSDKVLLRSGQLTVASDSSEEYISSAMKIAALGTAQQVRADSAQILVEAQEKTAVPEIVRASSVATRVKSPSCELSFSAAYKNDAVMLAEVCAATSSRVEATLEEKASHLTVTVADQAADPDTFITLLRSHPWETLLNLTFLLSDGKMTMTTTGSGAAAAFSVQGRSSATVSAHVQKQAQEFFDRWNATAKR